ncbi:MAG TPA: DUF1549 domain-containing protein, partial [Pirellulaceae bacterium]
MPVPPYAISSLRSSLIRICAAVVSFCLPLVLAGASGPTFNRDIRPILAENCYACHGPDAKSRKADLRLDVREEAIDLSAITPGAPDDSELIARIESHDPEYQMPPPDSRNQLTRAQKELLREWIREGAEYQVHWSHSPPSRPSLPEVTDPSWVRNPIDSFIAAGHSTHGLAPVEEADRATLLRRVSLDLIGLPPTESELTAFEIDVSELAYEAVIERLLASPRFGERWAIPWLD